MPISPKELFIQNKELRDQWAAVAPSQWFARVLIHARAELMSLGITQEQMKGAQILERIMLELPFEEADSAEFPHSGLKHDIDNPAEEKKKTETDKHS